MSATIRFNNPFACKGNWYKGNLHTHTTNSDGELSPDEVISLYKQKGYDFLSITDHGKLIYSEKLNREGICLIPGEELGGAGSELGTWFHLIALNLKEEVVPPNGEDISAQEIINKVREQGGEVILGHPYWCGVTFQDILPLEGYLGIEVFNSTCLYGIGKGESSVQWDDLLARDKQIWGFAFDDAHHYSDQKFHPMDAGKGWIMLKAKSLDRKIIMDSLKKGLFYSSCGPSIKNVSIEREVVRVETSAVTSITFVAWAYLGKQFTASSTLTQAEYKIKGT